MQVRVWLLLVAVGAGSYWLGRRGAAEVAPTTTARGAIAAEWDGGVLLASEVEAAVAALGPAGAQRQAEPEARRALLAGLARRALLASVARAEGFAERPAVRRVCDEALVEAYRQARTLEAVPASEAEVRAAFDARPELYSQPERVRVAHVVLPRDMKRADAQQLLADVRGASARDAYAFADLAQRHSTDGATRAAGGELPSQVGTELEARWGASVVAELLALEPGAVLPSLVESSDGYELLQFLGRLPPSATPFERVRDSLSRRLTSEKSAREWEAHVEALERARGLSLALTARSGNIPP